MQNTKVLFLILSSYFFLFGCNEFEVTELEWAEQEKFDISNEILNQTESKFRDVKKIMDSKCISCHNVGSLDLTFDQKEFISKNLVFPGRPESSKLYYRLKNVNLGKGVEDMPKGAMVISAEERKVFYDWIMALGEGDTKSIVAEISTSIGANQAQEGQGPIVFTINLDKPAPEDLNFPLNFSTGAINEALLGIDFTVDKSTLSIPQGQRGGSIIITINEDRSVETLENININVLENQLPADLNVLVEKKSLSLSIADNDFEYLAACSSDITMSTINEDIGSILITAQLDKAVNAEVRLPVQVTGGLLADIDYSISANEIVIPSNSNQGSVALTIIDDTRVEMNQNLQIACSNFDDAMAQQKVTITSPPISFTVEDNDQAVTPPPSSKNITAAITLNPNDPVLTEKSGAIIINAVLSEVAPETITLPIAISGTVSLNNDYTLSANIITIAQGSSSGQATLNIIDDTEVEPDEILNVNVLSYQNGDASLTVTPDQGVIARTLTSEDKNVESFVASIKLTDAMGIDLASDIPEDQGNILVEVTLPQALSQSVSFGMVLSGSAQTAIDYSTMDTKIDIPAGQVTGKATITIVDDAAVESKENLMINLTGFSDIPNYLVVNLSSTQLSVDISDNDLPPVAADFAGVKSILENNCMGCHAHKMNGQYPINLTDENTLASSSYVVKGDPAQSKLYFKLKGAGIVAASLETMPVGADPLPQSYLEAISTWITGLEEATPPPPPGGSNGEGSALACDSNSFKNGLKFQMRRLSNMELRNTLKIAFGETTYNKVDSILNQLPSETEPHMESFETSLLNGQIEAMSNVAAQIASLANSDNAVFEDIFGACAAAAPTSDICFKEFVQRMSKVLYRRPIETDELSELIALKSSPSVVAPKDGLYIAFLKMFQSPNFLLLFDRHTSASPAVDASPLAQVGFSTDQLLVSSIGEYDYVNNTPVVSHPNLALPINQLTIMTSFTPTSLLGVGNEDQYRIISQSNGIDSNNHIFMIGADNNNGNGERIRIRIKLCRADNSGCTTYTLRTNNSYYQKDVESKVILTWDGMSLKVYHNGTEVALTGDSIPNDRTKLASDPSMNTYIGSNHNNYAQFRGKVDNAFIFNRVVTQTEMDKFNGTTFNNDLKNAIVPPEVPASISKSTNTIDGEVLYERSQFEIAAFIAYTLTSSPPDEQLYTAAQNGDLSDINNIKTHAERLIKTNLGRKNIKAFINNWLELFGVTTSNYASTYLNGIDGNNLMEEAVEHVQEHAMKVIIDDNASYETLMAGNQIYIDSNRVASLYGLGSFNNTGKTTVDIKRAGLLATPGVNFTGGYFGSLVKRGVRIRTRVLCDVLGSPASAVNVTENQPTEEERFTLTNREYWYRFTELNPTCAGCHVNSNPLGNVFEGIDTIGRSRSNDAIFSEMGVFLRDLTLDTKTTPYLTELDTSEVNHPGELGTLIGSSDKAKACFAKQAVQFSLKMKMKNNEAYSCMLQNVTKQLETSNNSMIDVFTTIVASKYSLRQIKE